MKSKPTYWYKQSSVIPYRFLNGTLEILIIGSRKNKKWIFPKGIVEPDLTSKESSEKEALEEAGISGIVLENSIGSYTYKKWGGKCSVEMFPMEVKEIMETWEEDFRKRKWINVNDIEEYINSKKIIKIVKLFKDKILIHQINQ